MQWHTMREIMGWHIPHTYPHWSVTHVTRDHPATPGQARDQVTLWSRPDGTRVGVSMDTRAKVTKTGGKVVTHGDATQMIYNICNR